MAWHRHACEATHPSRNTAVGVRIVGKSAGGKPLGEAKAMRSCDKHDRVSIFKPKRGISSQQHATRERAIEDWAG